MERNREIQQTIEADRLPVLPFELEIAQRALARHIQEHDKLTVQQFEAMNQTSETWHDNAAADAVTQASQNLAKSAKETNRILNNSDVFEYTANPEDGVTLGSFVTVRYGASDEPDYFYLTGTTRLLTDEIQAALPPTEDINVITVFSPVGKALLGTKVGESTKFTTPADRVIDLHVDAIEQIEVTLPEAQIVG